MSAYAPAVSTPTSPRFSTIERRARLVDAALVRRCLNGDDAAWVTIVGRFSAYVYAIASRFGLREDRVEDVYQEVFMRVFTRLGSLRDEGALKPWIAQLTRRAAIDRLRSDAHEQVRPDMENLSQTQPELAEVEQAMALCRALDTLPAPYRDAITRFFLEDQSYRTIGAALGIPAGTVASRISRGLSMLRDTLEVGPSTERIG